MTTVLTVDGMSCEHCEQTVADALRDVSGVTEVEVDREVGRATVVGDVDAAALVGAVEQAGYAAGV